MQVGRPLQVATLPGHPAQANGDHLFFPSLSLSLALWNIYFPHKSRCLLGIAKAPYNLVDAGDMAHAVLPSKVR